MDAVVKNFPKSAPAAEKPLSDHVRAAPAPAVPRPSRDEAEAAVRTLLAYIGDNPGREGLVETPKRFVSAYEELFHGYQECPVEILDRTFSETGGYDQPVLVRDIPFYSHCEHHMTFTAASVNVGLWQFNRKTNELWATEHCRALFGLREDVELTRDTILGAIHAFGTPLRVTIRGKSIVCRVTDRGPFVRGRVIDLTPVAAHALGISGLARVNVERM